MEAPGVPTGSGRGGEKERGGGRRGGGWGGAPPLPEAKNILVGVEVGES